MRLLKDRVKKLRKKLFKKYHYMTNGENIFDKLWAENELPPEAKKDIMSNLEAFKILLEITDLFTVKQVQADMELLSAMGSNGQEENGESN